MTHNDICPTVLRPLLSSSRANIPQAWILSRVHRRIALRFDMVLCYLYHQYCNWQYTHFNWVIRQGHISSLIPFLLQAARSRNARSAQTARAVQKSGPHYWEHLEKSHSFSEDEVLGIRIELLAWYRTHRRKLPWRGDPPPYGKVEVNILARHLYHASFCIPD